MSPRHRSHPAAHARDVTTLAYVTRHPVYVISVSRHTRATFITTHVFITSLAITRVRHHSFTSSSPQLPKVRLLYSDLCSLRHLYQFILHYRAPTCSPLSPTSLALLKVPFICSLLLFHFRHILTAFATLAYFLHYRSLALLSFTHPPLSFRSPYTLLSLLSSPSPPRDRLHHSHLTATSPVNAYRLHHPSSPAPHVIAIIRHSHSRLRNHCLTVRPHHLPRPRRNHPLTSHHSTLPAT